MLNGFVYIVGILYLSTLLVKVNFKRWIFTLKTIDAFGEGIQIILVDQWRTRGEGEGGIEEGVELKVNFAP